ncbi:MAG: hypothetical protein GY949_10110 [Gammaproteobacteria bacterium]|nr:hypothetical protein [Gammaproteobacteria bacterium]
MARWIDHFDAMGWGEHRNHMLCWMAFTLRYPETKINHMLLLGSGEGCGKDFLLYPLIRAMDNNCNTISGEDLLDGCNEYLLSTKYVHVNEAELGDRRESQAVYTKLKPLAAAPPETLMVNQKGIKRIKLRNIVNASMTANTLLPIRINGPSRRFFAVWSDLNPRDEDDNMMPEWVEYWNDRWCWMKSTGWEHVVHYLIHEVDLSKFNPATPPPVTEYLREIKEVSKSPMQQTIDNFIRKRHGAFECEILTAGDMSDTMRVGMLEPTDMLVDPKYFTPKRIGMMMREQGIPLVRHGNAKLWILRNRMKYAGMTSTAIYNEYQMQLKEMRGASSLSNVK